MAEEKTVKGCALRIMTPQAVPCPNCGYEVELFPDEERRECPKCGHEVTKEKTFHKEV